jgi:hypothetical protein
MLLVFTLCIVGVFWGINHRISSKLKPDNQKTISWNDVVSEVTANCDISAVEKFQTQVTDESVKLLYMLSLLENFGIKNSGPPNYGIHEKVNYLGLGIPVNGKGECSLVWLDTGKGKYILYQDKSGTIIKMPIANSVIPTVTPKYTGTPKDNPTGP